MLRKIIVPKENQYTITLPNEYLNRKIEVLVLPFDVDENEPEQKKAKLNLTTFKCGGKLRDFDRGDAYHEQF